MTDSKIPPRPWRAINLPDGTGGGWPTSNRWAVVDAHGGRVPIDAFDAKTAAEAKAAAEHIVRLVNAEPEIVAFLEKAASMAHAAPCGPCDDWKCKLGREAGAALAKVRGDMKITTTGPAPYEWRDGVVSVALPDGMHRRPVSNGGTPAWSGPCSCGTDCALQETPLTDRLRDDLLAKLRG